MGARFVVQVHLIRARTRLLVAEIDEAEKLSRSPEMWIRKNADARLYELAAAAKILTEFEAKNKEKNRG